MVTAAAIIPNLGIKIMLNPRFKTAAVIQMDAMVFVFFFKNIIWLKKSENPYKRMLTAINGVIK